MASALKNLSHYISDTIPNAESKKFGIVVSDYYSDITGNLYSACIETLVKHGVREADIHTCVVPGTFEITAGVQHLLEQKAFDTVIGIACVIKGDTDHDQYINHAVAQGLTQLEIQYKIPCIFGVLTPNTMEQAIDRSGGKHGNKGIEVALAAIKMACLK